MARKYDLISEIYNRTAKRVSGNPESWQQFLDSACRNFKLRFDEQLLIFAQRPDATAVLEIERWNEGFGRWVNRGARGIAVFEDSDRGRQRLKHYFDISDTHPSRYSRPVPIWQMKPEYEAEVIETLESTFGTLSEKDTLEAAILSAAKNAVEDNIPDYVGDLLYTVENSFLEELDEDMVAAMYRKVVRNSVAYMLMSRLGLDTGDYFERSDFEDVINFNTGDTLNALGFATSDIAEMALTEIARTINALDKENRIIAGQEQGGYNEAATISEERGSEHERNHLFEAGGLRASEPDAAGAARGDAGQVRQSEAQVSEGASSSPVLQSADPREAHGTSGRSAAQSDLDGGEARFPDEREAGRDGEPERSGLSGVGEEDEQSEELGAGDRVSGSGLRLNWHDRSDEDKSIPFLGSADDVNAILMATPHLKKSKALIREFLESKPDDHARTEFIKECFNNDYTEVILDYGRRMGYKTYENVLHLWEGSYLSRTKQVYYDWGVVAAHFEGLRLLGELQDNMKPLPSMEGQQELIGSAEEKSSAFSFSQEIIDAVLTRGSNVEEGKFRIYEQFQKSLSAKENADFLKDEYGWGGSYPVIVGTGIDEQHDGKGITLQRGFGENDPRITLKWNQVEKRIAELIRMDRYLNPKEVELYPAWLAKQEERRQEQEERHAVREVLDTAPPAKEPDEATHYEYHLGDKVYFGADEFEILSLAGDRVMLYDTKFPLFRREETRADFERKVQENPLNDHLKVRDSPATPVPSEQKNQEYLQTKEENPDSILLFQNGDFYEAFHEDAKVIGDILGIAPSTQQLAETLEAPIQIPEARLQLILHLLNDRGYDVAVTTIEDGERVTRNIISTSKDDPVESQPVGRIEYLGSNGEVGESIEYTSEYQFLKDIKEENFYGSPMSIVLYRSRSGDTISQDFLSQLDPPPQGFKVEDFVQNPERLMERAKNLINDFCVEEYSSEADFSDLTREGIAYTTITDKELEVQVEVDLVHFQIKTLVENQVVRFTEYKSLEELVEHGLSGLSFDDLVSVPDRLLTHFLEEEPDEPNEFEDIDPELIRMQLESDEPSPFVEQVMEDVERLAAAEQEPESEPEQKSTEELKPSWEQKKTRVQTFDLHPDIPMAERHTFDLANNKVEEVNKKERFHRNYAAIKVLKDCQSENRFASPEEQIILSKYVGWGGIPEVFDEGADSWRTEYAMLKSILTPDEYGSARESVLTAFYTPPEVIQGIYKVMERMGFREGNILEPSCGIGNFIGMLPQEMQQAKMYGVEIDTISAAIAQQLYQRTSIAAQPFEQANIPDSFFDAVVGNVPFGDFSVADKRYDKHHFLIHDYFFAKSLDKLRPGGVMALVTSKGTMDKENNAVRKYIAQRADLLGAIRLPNNTFKGNAGTEVVSDILILQKRDRLIDLEPDWVHLDTDENGIKMNSYFVQHPEMVLGEVKMVSGRFGETVTAVELKPEGTGYRTKTRFAKFFNLPELMSMFKAVADIKTADMLDLPVPKAKYHNIAVKPSEMQKEMVAGLAERAEKIRGGGVNPSVDNMLTITNDGRKLALDQRLINDMLPDFEGSKVNACVENVYRIWQETTDKKSAQLVFCDLSTPKNNAEFSVYNDIRKKLIERGIPENEIRFIHEADTEIKKQELFKKVRKGEVRVLMGSTQKMGAGTNCQDKLIALHDIDCPWRPSDLEQRSGRIVRQGNGNPEVDIYRYVTEGTFDAYLYQLIEGKQKFASQIMTSKSPVRFAEDIDATALSYAEIKMLATGNPYIKEKMDLDIQVQKLRLIKSSFLSEKYALEDKIIKYYPQQIATLREAIAGLEADGKTRSEHAKPTDERFIGMVVQGVSHSEKADAGKAIIEACKQMKSPDPVPLGSYRGFDLELSFDTVERVYMVRIQGKTSRKIALGDDAFGNISRIDNAIERIPDELEDKRIALENAEKQLENAKVEVDKPFSKEEELTQMTARLKELDILLNLDKRENDMADDVPDESDGLEQEKDRSRTGAGRDEL